MANPSRSQKSMRTTQGKKPKSKTKKSRHIGLKIAIGIVSLLCVALLTGIGIFFFYVKDAPALSEKKLDATVSSKLYDSNGNIFEDLGAEKREKVSATKIPQELFQTQWRGSCSNNGFSGAQYNEQRRTARRKYLDATAR